MRLTDKCTINRPSGPLYIDTACMFGHTGGSIVLESSSFRSIETARVIVGPLEDLASVQAPHSGWTVEHKGVTYNVTAILPRYRQRGRLHHVSLDLKVAT